MSFFSADFYRDVGRHWRGIAFLYLLLLLAVSWIPVMFKIQAKVNEFIFTQSPKIIKQIPKIKISKGEAIVSADMPYIIKDPDTGAPFIIIDTTGKTENLGNTNAQGLLTKTKFIIKRNELETRTFDLSDVGDLTIDQDIIRSLADSFRQWFIILLYPFVLLFSYGYRIIQALMYALIGKFFSKKLKADLNYGALLSLTMVSVTPVIIVNSIYNYLDLKIPFPFWGTICFFIAMGYLRFAIKANAAKEIELKP
jgi:uncharacterized membrane protein YagU involved in acid resistance